MSVSGGLFVFNGQALPPVGGDGDGAGGGGSPPRGGAKASSGLGAGARNGAGDGAVSRSPPRVGRNGAAAPLAGDALGAGAGSSALAAAAGAPDRAPSTGADDPFGDIWARSSSRGSSTAASSLISRGSQGSNLLSRGSQGSGLVPSARGTASAGSAGAASFGAGSGLHATAGRPSTIDEDDLYGPGDGTFDIERIRESVGAGDGGIGMGMGAGAGAAMPSMGSFGSTGSGVGMDSAELAMMMGRASAAPPAPTFDAPAPAPPTGSMHPGTGAGGGRGGRRSKGRKKVDPLAAGGDPDQAHFEASLESFLSRPPPKVGAAASSGPSLPKMQAERRRLKMQEYAPPRAPSVGGPKRSTRASKGGGKGARGKAVGGGSAVTTAPSGRPLDYDLLQEAFRYAEKVSVKVNTDGLMGGDGAAGDDSAGGGGATGGPRRAPSRRTVSAGPNAHRGQWDASGADGVPARASGKGRSRPVTTTAGPGGKTRKLKRKGSKRGHATGSDPLAERALYGGKASGGGGAKPARQDKDSAKRKAHYDDLVEQFTSGKEVERLRKQLQDSQRSLESSEGFIAGAKSQWFS